MGTQFLDVPIALLAPHPENSNHMTAEMLSKLRKHIERTGRYEPLTVRPHPNFEGKYEVLNGHNRLRVLQVLGHKSAHCTVWFVDNAQARLYLATLNRLAGSDVTERRAALLENLLETFDLPELSMLLPDSQNQLRELERLSRIEPEDVLPSSSTQARSQAPVILDFVLEEDEAKEVNLALDTIQVSEEAALSRGQALFRLAHCYLALCRPDRVM